MMKTVGKAAIGAGSSKANLPQKQVESAATKVIPTADYSVLS